MLPISFSKRSALLLACAAFLLAGCGDSEPAERKAFIAFLQTRVLDKTGVRVPKPNAEERKVWGRYGSHYDVILNFHQAMDEKVAKPLAGEMQRGRIQTMQDLVDRSADIKSVYGNLQRFEPQLNEELARADQARQALAQPADLKGVFDAAFERIVRTPANGLKDALPPAVATLKAALELGDFLGANREKIKVRGPLIEASDPALQREVQTRLSALQELQKKSQEAQRRLQTLTYGGS